MKRACATAALLLLAIVSCTGRRERQKEILDRVAKQDEENSHSSIPAHNPVTSLNEQVSVKLDRIDPSPGGMNSFVVTVTNSSATPIKQIDGQVVIKTEHGNQFQLGYEIPMKIAASSSQQYPMLVEPRWEKSDPVTDTTFYVSSVEPDL